jgi:glycoprotein endo-alpha-1,2-mannosidase
MWRSAITSRAPLVSITSFNEWGEGTQIEPAKPYTVGTFSYKDYTPENTSFYLHATRSYVDLFNA